MLTSGIFGTVVACRRRPDRRRARRRRCGGDSAPRRDRQDHPRRTGRRARRPAYDATATIATDDPDDDDSAATDRRQPEPAEERTDVATRTSRPGRTLIDLPARHRRHVRGAVAARDLEAQAGPRPAGRHRITLQAKATGGGWSPRTSSTRPSTSSAAASTASEWPRPRSRTQGSDIIVVEIPGKVDKDLDAHDRLDRPAALPARGRRAAARQALRPRPRRRLSPRTRPRRHRRRRTAPTATGSDRDRRPSSQRRATTPATPSRPTARTASCRRGCRTTAPQP